MRRFLIATSLVACFGVACISGDPAQPETLPYSLYSIHEHRGDTRSKQAPARRIGKVKRRYDRSWYPRRGRISPRWTTIVIHHSATATGGAKVFDKHHRQNNGWDELGYHFVIGNGTDTPDGYVEVGSRWYKQKHGAHCKTPDNYYNEHGIGICLVGNFDKTRPTGKQLASLERLVRFLCDVCNIRPKRVTTHGALTHKTRCPGRHFSLPALRRAISTPATVTSIQ